MKTHYALADSARRSTLMGPAASLVGAAAALALSAIAVGACSSGAATEAPTKPSAQGGAAASALFEPAFVEGTPGSICKLHPEGDLDPTHAIPAGIDEDGVARFQARRPVTASDTARLALDCTDRSGNAATYTVDLQKEESFAPHPFDASRANLEPRPALEGDPLAYSSEELIKGGYGLRPDPVRNPDGYARWLKFARQPAHKVGSAHRDVPTTNHRNVAAKPLTGTAPNALGSSARTLDPRPSGGIAPEAVTASTSTFWTGGILSGEYQQGSQLYGGNVAQFNVPSVVAGAYGIAGTYVSIWNGLGGITPVNTAPQFLQAEMWIYTNQSSSTYFLHSQCFSEAQPSKPNSPTFTPAIGDTVYSLVWYCDANGSLNTQGGYGCTYMTNGSLVWECDRANDPACPSWALNPGDTASPLFGDTAEFIIEHDNSEASFATGPWPQLTGPLTMTGYAEVLSGGTNIVLPDVDVGSDPNVSIWGDGFPASNPDHLIVYPMAEASVPPGGYSPDISPNVTWEVTQALPPALPKAPGCTYSGGAAVLNVDCAGANPGDTISIFSLTPGGYDGFSGNWENLQNPAPSGNFVMSANPGSLTVLACSSNSAWGLVNQMDLAPVGPGDVGCDATATTVQIAPPACTPIACGGRCGFVSDGCGHVENCGVCIPNCPPNESWNGTRCVPFTCPCGGVAPKCHVCE